MKPWKTAVLAGAGVFTVGFLVFAVPTWLSWQAIKAQEKSGAETEGTITELRPHDHGNCSYRFEADGKPYTGSGRGCSDGPVGAKIDVYFDRDNPDNSSNLVPSGERFPFIWLTWILVGMPAFMVFGVLRNRKGAPPPES